MDEKNIELLEKLAEEFGTTADYLWGVLLHQAPISGAVDLAVGVVMAAVAVRVLSFVKGRQAEWRYEEVALVYVVTVIYCFIFVLWVSCHAKGIIAAFFNPEYWALAQILGKF